MNDVRFVHRNGIYVILLEGEDNEKNVWMILVFPFWYVFPSGCSIYVDCFFPPRCVPGTCYRAGIATCFPLVLLCG